VVVYEGTTIAAISSAPGEAGIGIVRLSGRASLEIAGRVFRARRGGSVADFKTHTVHYGHIYDADAGRVVDEALVVVMKAPRSYTREDVVEFHCHGGMVALQSVLELVLREGATLAEPGEFTKRAFLNGRLDLAQAEAVIDLIRAKTGTSLEAAVGQLQGKLSQRVRHLRQELLGILAEVEGTIDFPEEIMDSGGVSRIGLVVEEVKGEVEKLLEGAETGRIIRQGLRTVIAGKPNVGKSSLLNALLRENRAIVTNVPGTTRDVIEEYLNVRGVPVVIVDTAGICNAADTVERIGVERTRRELRAADLVLVVVDDSRGLEAEDREVLEAARGRRVMVLVNKVDLGAGRVQGEEIRAVLGEVPILRISARENRGIDALEDAIVEMVYGGRVVVPASALVTNIRHQQALFEAKKHLQDVLAGIEEGVPVDLLTIDLKGAWERLGEITGETVGEDIIDEIFSRFCLGK